MPSVGLSHDAVSYAPLAEASEMATRRHKFCANSDILLSQISCSS
jgi:hypothetical protein